MLKRVLSFILCLALVLPCMGMGVFAADGENAISAIADWHVYGETLADDGYIGIPVEINTYIKGETDENTQIILYVINTNTERIGTESDEVILTDLLERGFIVLVLDYKNNPKAKSPELDWSCQQIRSAAAKGSYLNGAEHSSQISYVLPAGYNITTDEYYFSLDKHGADGSLQRIVDVWNSDFKSVKGSKTITYADGTVKKVSEVTAESIYDCVKPDGTPIDLDLRMDIVYPTNPENKVPVMTLASSSETRLWNWTDSKRPHLTGFLFSGYAGAVFDYAYVPMARDDHYGYFDGNGYETSITGDNKTYSMHMYSGIKSDTAAIRKLRYLADYEGDKYRFDVDNIGVYGNSKAGVCTRLGNPNPELLPELRYLPGHHGETRFENGDTEDDGFGIIDGGEEQPWLTYSDGSKIPSNVQFVYAQCGGGQDSIVEGSAPMYITGSMQDSSYFSFFPNVVSACYRSDVPALYYSMPDRKHELAYGSDRDYGRDTYYDFMQMADYWLKDDAVICAYIDPVNGADEVGATDEIKVKFTGSVSEDEINKVKIINTQTGEAASGTWQPAFGRTEWSFTPDGLDGGYTYRVNVPKTLAGENGKAIESSKVSEFKVSHGNAVSAGSVSGTRLLKTADSDDGVYIVFDEMDYSSSTVTKLRFKVENDAANSVLVYAIDTLDEENISNSTIGEKIAEVTLMGKGSYEADVTEYVNSLQAGEKAAFVLKALKNKETKVISDFNFENGTVGASTITKVTFGEYTNPVISDEMNATEGGSKSAKIESYNNNGLALVPYVNYPNNFVKMFHSIIPSGSDISAADVGRKFNISYKVYDTTQRNIRFTMSGKDIGAVHELVNLKAYSFNDTTAQNEWKTFSYDYRIDDLAYKTNARTLWISAETTGDREVLEGNDVCLNELAPFYFDDVVVTESVTEVDIADGSGAPKIVLHPADVKEAEGLAGGHVQNGDESSEVFDGLYASGGDVSFKSGDNKKAYLKVSLEDYAVADSALVKINVTGGLGKILVYGVEDTDWSADTINYLNAYGNDRFSYDADKSSVYDGKAIAEVEVDALGEYTIDVSDFARHMLGKGKTEMTLLLVSAMQGGDIIREENFDSGSVDFEITQGGGLTSGKIVSDEDHTTGEGKSYFMDTPYKWSRCKFDFLGTADLTPEDVGRKFKLTYWMKSDKTGSFINCLIHRKGDNDKYQIANPVYTTANEWQQITYIFEITADMFAEDYSVETVPAYIDFEYDKMGLRADGGVEDVKVYVDDFVLTEITYGDIAFEAVAEQSDEEEQSGYTYNQDFESANGSTYSSAAGPISTSLTTTNGFGSSGSYCSFTTDDNHTENGSKSVVLHAVNTYDRVMFYNIIDSLTATDLGRQFKVSFWAKSNVSGKAKIGMTSTGDGGIGTDLGMSFKAADTWQKFEYVIEITQEMIDGGKGLLRIQSYEARDIYIDDISSKEIIAAPKTYSYIADMESIKRQWSNSNEPTSTTTGFTWNNKGYLSSDINHTPGGTKSVWLPAEHTYDRVLFYNITDSLADEDLGRKFRVTFWAQSDIVDEARVSITSYSSDTRHSIKLISFEAANTWQKFDYEFEITQEMIDNSAGLLRIDAYNLNSDTASRNIYIDDLAVYEVSGEEICLDVTESVIVSNKKLSESSIMVGRGDKTAEVQTGIKKAYIRFESGDYKYTQKATLNFNAVSASGQNIKIYGVMGQSYPDELTFENAPANADGAEVDLNLVYGGAPIAQISVNALESYSVDVSDYVKANAGYENIFIIVNEQVSGSEYMDLDFETFSFSAGVDYTSDGEVAVTDGKANIAGKTISLKNVFGNGAKTTKEGKTYVVSADVTPESDSSVTLAVTDSDGTVYGSVSKEVLAGECANIAFEYIAEDALANMITISSDTANYSIDNVRARCDSLVMLDDFVQLMVETAVEIETEDKMSKISLSVAGGDSISVDGENIGATVTKEFKAGSTISLDAAGAGEFLYWIDSERGTILSYEEAYNFTVGSDRSIAAVYADDTDVFVTFTSMSNKLVAAGLASSVKVPENPYVYGYRFSGWYVGGEMAELTVGDLADVSENTEFKAGFVRIEASYKVMVNGIEEIHGYNEKVTLTADAEKDGSTFSYWKRDGEIVSYNTDYSFYVNGDTTVEAVYGESSDATIVLAMAKPVLVDGGKIAFFAERDIPSEYELIETGILIGTTDGLTLENASIKATAKSTLNKGQYTIRKANVSSGDTYYGAAYAIYRDTDGNVITAYSNEVSYTVE